MLVSELAERADVPLATVKYYLREGLLPAGETTGPRRAEYGDLHLRRLRVLRLLREVGGVPVTSLRQVADALDDETRSVHDVMTLIADVITTGPTIAVDPASLHIVDEGSVKDIPGVQVVHSGNFVGVVAEREENAIRAAQQLKVTWSAEERSTNCCAS